jgi:hypothetical protein
MPWGSQVALRVVPEPLWFWWEIFLRRYAMRVRGGKKDCKPTRRTNMSYEIIRTTVVYADGGEWVVLDGPHVGADADHLAGDHGHWETELVAINREQGEAFIIDDDIHPTGAPARVKTAPHPALAAWYKLSNTERAALNLPTDAEVEDPEEFFKGWSK